MEREEGDPVGPPPVPPVNAYRFQERRDSAARKGPLHDIVDGAVAGDATGAKFTGQRMEAPTVDSTTASAWVR